MGNAVSDTAPNDSSDGALFVARRRLPLSWIGLIPFFLYISLFLLLPTLWLCLGAFQKSGGGYTLDHLRALSQPQFRQAYWLSIRLSLVTALAGGVFGLFVGYAAVKEGAPRWIRSTLTTFSAVAANFAGIPLAFAFVATLGSTGVLTLFLAEHGLNLYTNGFTLFSFTGLAITYVYFQMPLMILIISPALDGLRREWREAAANLGASQAQYLRLVALPILLPSLLGAMVLLFGNALAAYATPYALTGGQSNLVPIVIRSVVAGEVSYDPQLADALAFGMILIIGVSVTVYALLQRQANKWLP